MVLGDFFDVSIIYVDAREATPILDWGEGTIEAMINIYNVV